MTDQETKSDSSPELQPLNILCCITQIDECGSYLKRKKGMKVMVALPHLPRFQRQARKRVKTVGAEAFDASW